MKNILLKLKLKRVVSALLLGALLVSGADSGTVFAEEFGENASTDYASTREYIEAEYIKTDDISNWSGDSQANYQIAEGSTDTDYMLTAAKWIDRVKGEAEITMTGRTEEPSVALYVFTTCFHGSSNMSRQQVIAKDIKALANAYDRVDVIAIDGPDEWAELVDYSGKYGGIHTVKEFTADTASTAQAWANSEITKWGGAHFTGNVPAAIRKYLFGAVDAEISTANMVHRPSAIYVSADMHYLTNAVDAGNDEEASHLAKYATEEFFTFITEHYLGTTKRYFSSSQTGANDSSKNLLVKRKSTYDAEYMKIIAGVFNPDLYSEGATMVKPWSGKAPDQDTTNYALTNSKFASDYNYRQDILSAGILLPDKQMALENIVADEFEIISAEAYTTSGMNVNVGIDGQKVRATAESFLTGDEITLKIKVKLRAGQSKQYGAAATINSRSAMLDGDTDVLIADSVKLMPITETLQLSLQWDDDNNRDGVRPENLAITLIGSDGSRYDVSPSNETSELQTVQDVLKYNNEEKITYFLDYELPEGYAADDESWVETADGYQGTVKLLYKPVTKSIRVSGAWNDDNNRDGERPNKVKATLKGSDGSSRTLSLTGDNNWEVTYENLPVYYDEGELITYSLAEISIAEYSVKIVTAGDGESYEATFTHTPLRQDITVYQKWDDDNDADGLRKDTHFILSGSDGSNYSGVIKKDAADQTYTFKNLYVCAGGEEITYTLTEKTIAGYTSEIKQAKGGFMVTNSHKVSGADVTNPPQEYEDDDDFDVVQKIVTVPQTGDDSKLLIYAGIAVAALIVGVCCGIYIACKRKRDKSE